MNGFAAYGLACVGVVFFLFANAPGQMKISIRVVLGTIGALHLLPAWTMLWILALGG